MCAMQTLLGEAVSLWAIKSYSKTLFVPGRSLLIVWSYFSLLSQNFRLII